MKIRNGFVSNSSSSSFIVEHKLFLDDLHNRKPRLTPQQIALLEDYGFFKINHNYPSRLEADCCGDPQHYVNLEQDFEYELNYGYYTFCNQDEVITWLLKNKIPFKAANHYGHTNVFWDGGKEMIVARNFGLELEMYGINHDIRVEQPVRKVSIEKYLKGEDYI